MGISGWLLALTALIGTGLMVAVNWHSRPYIEHNERQVLLHTVNKVLPAGLYDNDILNDTKTLHAPSLSANGDQILIYRARRDGKPVAAVLKVDAPDGYSGPITLLVGVLLSGKIHAVRVIKHRETPGLGDGIESQRSDWINSFDGRSLGDPAPKAWKVKRDGGEFDQLTGATISPRAIVGAVYRSLQFYRDNRKDIYK
jgi:electron transport complex protein RnfG